MTFATLVLLALAFVVSACAPAAPAALTIDQLKNAEYQSEFPASKKAKLTNGAYEEEIAPGSASKLVIKLGDKYAIGDLNGDSAADAAVILAANSGGSGVFTYLAAVINDKGTPKHVASVALGDRVQIKSISIQSGEITLDMVTHGPNDPLCCPTQQATQKYRLQGDRLVEVK